MIRSISVSSLRCMAFPILHLFFPLLLLLTATAGSAQSALKEGTAQVNGAELAWYSLGQGPPLLLITGYGATRELWPPDLVARLAQRRQVIFYDHRGMGASSAPDEPYGLDLLARDALGLMEALGLRQADLLGWSMGAAVALEAALMRPDRVNSLVLYGACADPDHLAEVVQRMSAMSLQEFLDARFSPGWAKSHPEAMASIPKPEVPVSQAAVTRQREALISWPGILDRLPQVAQPVLLVAGEEDWVCPPGQSKKLRDHIQNAKLMILPGGHWLMYQDRQGLARVVEEWLQ